MAQAALDRKLTCTLDVPAITETIFDQGKAFFEKKSYDQSTDTVVLERKLSKDIHAFTNSIYQAIHENHNVTNYYYGVQVFLTPNLDQHMNIHGKGNNLNVLKDRMISVSWKFPSIVCIGFIYFSYVPPSSQAIKSSSDENDSSSSSSSSSESSPSDSESSSSSGGD